MKTNDGSRLLNELMLCAQFGPGEPTNAAFSRLLDYVVGLERGYSNLHKWAKQLVENDGAGATYHAGRAMEARDEVRAIVYYDEPMYCVCCKRDPGNGPDDTCVVHGRNDSSSNHTEKKP